MDILVKVKAMDRFRSKLNSFRVLWLRLLTGEFVILGRRETTNTDLTPDVNPNGNPNSNPKPYPNPKEKTK